MALVRQYLIPENAQFLSSNFPAFVRNVGTNFPVSALAYDGAGATERAYWKFTPFNYGSGNITCDIEWYASSGTTNAVVWESALAAITPETDTQDTEAKGFATVNTVTDTHLGTTAKRLHTATITISNLDSITAGDEAWLRISRLSADAGDTMTVDVYLTSIRLSYSDS